MTADCPQDFPYEPVLEPKQASIRRGYWAVAKGLQQVDGLKTSEFLDDVAQQHIQGARDIHQTGEILRHYYQERERERAHRSPGYDLNATKEADLVSQRIVELLAKNSFSLVPSVLSFIHHALFQDLDASLYQPGIYKKVALQKSELILNGDSVVYADPALIERSLSFLFEEETLYAYGIDFDAVQLEHFSRFVARLWQVHPFVEGNTRTTAVFAILYLRNLGFDVDNAPFEHNARYFRDALVRANYRNVKARVLPDRGYLVRFFENLLAGTQHELLSRDLMVQALYDDPSLLRNVDPSKALTHKE